MAVEFKGDVTPDRVWAALKDDSNAYMVDVRTRPEWAFVGVPDLSETAKPLFMVEWRRYPDMAMNDEFVKNLSCAIKDVSAPPAEIYFICRSGVRSREAAQALVATLDAAAPVALYNVAEGFEGDLDAAAHRGVVNGWKKRGLPWRQE